MTALTELRAILSGGGPVPLGRAADHFEEKFGKTPVDDLWTLVIKAFNGSLDAAKSLHEAVLPGWEWRLRDNRAWVWTGVLVYGGEEVETAEFCGLPARAWLLAILDALIAKEASDG